MLDTYDIYPKTASACYGCTWDKGDGTNPVILGLDEQEAIKKGRHDFAIKDDIEYQPSMRALLVDIGAYGAKVSAMPGFTKKIYLGVFHSAREELLQIYEINDFGGVEKIGGVGEPSVVASVERRTCVANNRIMGSIKRWVGRRKSGRGRK